MDNQELITAQIAASKAHAAGAQIAERAQRLGWRKSDWREPADRDLGRLLGSPSAFWAKAAAIEAYGDEELVDELQLENQVASAQMAIGNTAFVRDSLMGQAQWLGVVALKMMARAESQNRPEQIAQFIKLALTAQRQAAQCLASAAVLDKQRDDRAITVVGRSS